MNEKPTRLPKNAEGKFYVNEMCIDCSACYIDLPEHFALDENTNLAYVHKQPESQIEKSLCEEAMDACPTEAILDDGKSGNTD